MREIKFRAWNTCSAPSKMIYWGKDFYRLSLKNGHFNIGESPGNTRFSLHVLTSDFFKDSMPSCQGDVIIMQYTGLKDKNGEEIYEGDIVICGIDSGFVYWLDGDPAFYIDFGEGRTGWLTDQYQAIGNIHENPELLK